MIDTGVLNARMADVTLDVAAQCVSFGPGLYIVTLAAPAFSQIESLTVPCVRLDPLPPSASAPGRAHVACLNDGQWILGGGHAAFLRVTGGQAALLLTTYNQTGGGQPPQVRIRLVQDAEAAAGLIAAGTRLASAPAAPVQDAVPALRFTLQCSKAGSKSARSGNWVQTDEPDDFVEAFSVDMPTGDLPALEYQAIMGVDWTSPWMPAPELCGSVGLGLAILGLRIRLHGPGAETFEVVLSGRSGNREVGPVTTGELAFDAGLPLTAVKLELRRLHRPDRRARPRSLARTRKEDVT